MADALGKPPVDEAVRVDDDEVRIVLVIFI